jgi:subtilisin family serine protease
VDTGVRYTHEDLAANMWVSPADGGHGWNALTGTNNPYDGTSPFSRSHGTLVAGIIGAVGNNGKGVTGVAWRIQMMICQGFSNSTGAGSISDAVTCLDYARTNGAKVINASWGFNPDSLSLSNAVYSLRQAGVIVVAASGNSGLDIDVTPSYPASYDFDNVISVAYTTRNDTLATASNYGATNVDLAAPGEQIYSTYAATDAFYNSDSGSSFAAPFVTGAAALVLARYPADSHPQIIARILNATDPLPSLSGKCVTGGRLNLRKALSPPIHLSVVPRPGGEPFHLRVTGGPNRVCVVEVTTNLTSWSPVFTNITSADGAFDFTDLEFTNSLQRFFRAVSGL